MTYRAWNLKPLDRAALRELTQAIAEQATEELEYNAQNDEPWSEQKYAAALAAQQKENALLAGVLTARGITDPTEALTLLAGEEELSDPSLLTDMDKACERIWRAIDEGETIVVFGDYDVDGVTATALLYQHLKGMGATVKCMLPSREGHRHPACCAEQPASAAVQLLQAALCAGHQPAHRCHPRKGGHFHQRVYWRTRQPAGGQARELQGAQGAQPHPDQHRPAQDQIHERARLQGSHGVHQLL